MVLAPMIAPPAAEKERQERTGTQPVVEVWDAFEFWVEKDLKKEGVFCFFG